MRGPVFTRTRRAPPAPDPAYGRAGADGVRERLFQKTGLHIMCYIGYDFMYCAASGFFPFIFQYPI